MSTWFPPARSLWGLLAEISRNQEAEEQDRQQWIGDVKQRLGLVCADDYDRMKASACHAADRCELDATCPFVSGCRQAETNGEQVSTVSARPLSSPTS